MKIAIEGCAHGELEKIYETIEHLEKAENIKIDVLLCCGDFQTLRNRDDLKTMAVPQKYSFIGSFHKYYSGEKVAPVLTILIGGNHEASNYLQELPYGGWVAPRIYYLGYAGVINIAGIRIAGLSGIYKDKDYSKGHFEVYPYEESTKRSVYHIRNLEVFRLKQLSGHIDIFLSHDWPTNVVDFGDKEQLIRYKPHFKEDIEANKLGSKPCEELLNLLKPTYWFSAHLHCKFAAYISHVDNTFTRFLALDKCLPKRRFLQVIDIPHDEKKKIEIEYDLEWLTILVLTNHLLSTKPVANYMPGPYGNERYNFTPSVEEKASIMAQLKNDLKIPENFIRTAQSYNDKDQTDQYFERLNPFKNPQTVELCRLLKLDDPVELILKKDDREFQLGADQSCDISSDSDKIDREYSYHDSDHIDSPATQQDQSMINDTLDSEKDEAERMDKEEVDDQEMHGNEKEIDHDSDKRPKFAGRNNRMYRDREEHSP